LRSDKDLTLKYGSVLFTMSITMQQIC